MLTNQQQSSPGGELAGVCGTERVVFAGFYRKFIGKWPKTEPVGLTGFLLWCII